MPNLASRLEVLNSQKKSNLSRQAYEQIKEAIVWAKFKPGECLSENMLARVMDMSRTPVREALKELAREGLVEILPGRGAFVKGISLKDLKDIYELRGVLECLAAQTAIKNITDAEIARAREEWLAVLADHKREEVSWERISILDNQFHNMIINKSDNLLLQEFMLLVNQKILLYQRLSAQASGDVEGTVRQHLEIIDLFKARDIEKLIPTLAGHIETAAKNVILKEIREHL